MAKKPNPFAGKETKAEEKAEMKGKKGKLPPWLMKGKEKEKEKEKAKPKAKAKAKAKEKK